MSYYIGDPSRHKIGWIGYLRLITLILILFYMVRVDMSIIKLNDTLSKPISIRLVGAK